MCPLAGIQQSQCCHDLSNSSEQLPDFNHRTWTMFDNLCDLFNPLCEAIHFLEGDKYPTISFVALLVTVLFKDVMNEQKNVRKQNTGDSARFGKIVNCLYSGLKELITEMPNVFWIASLLDPRTKHLIFEQDSKQRTKAEHSLNDPPQGSLKRRRTLLEVYTSTKIAKTCLPKIQLSRSFTNTCMNQSWL